MLTWYAGRDADGWHIQLVSVPFWAWAAQELGDRACGALEQLAGICLIDPPEWMTRLKWGEHDWDDPDEPRFLDAADLSWAFGQQLVTGFGAWRRERRVARIPVTVAQLREWLPDWGGDWLDLEDDGEAQG